MLFMKGLNQLKVSKVHMVKINISRIYNIIVFLAYDGNNLKSFVQHFKNLVEYIFSEDRFMWRQGRSRMEEKVQQIFSNLLSAETDLKIFKERVEDQNDTILSTFFF